MAETSVGIVGLRELLPRRDLRVLVGLLIFVTARVGRTAARVYASHMSDTVVETQYGRLKGVLLDQKNKNLAPVEAYFGLQYASVLGGELRFMPPTSSLEKWDGIRVAVQFRPVCPQRIPSDEELRRRLPLGRVAHLKRVIAFLDKQSEECLNLNIYVPVRGKLLLKGESTGAQGHEPPPQPQTFLFLNFSSWRREAENLERHNQISVCRFFFPFIIFNNMRQSTWKG